MIALYAMRKVGWWLILGVLLVALVATSVVSTIAHQRMTTLEPGTPGWFSAGALRATVGGVRSILVIAFLIVLVLAIVSYAAKYVKKWLAEAEHDKREEDRKLAEAAQAREIESLPKPVQTAASRVNHMMVQLSQTLEDISRQGSLAEEHADAARRAAASMSQYIGATVRHARSLEDKAEVIDTALDAVLAFGLDPKDQQVRASFAKATGRLTDSYLRSLMQNVAANPDNHQLRDACADALALQGGATSAMATSIGDVALYWIGLLSEVQVKLTALETAVFAVRSSRPMLEANTHVQASLAQLEGLRGETRDRLSITTPDVKQRMLTSVT